MKNILLIILFITVISCSKNIIQPEKTSQLTKSILYDYKNEDIENSIPGHINNNNVRIRSNPDTNSEILGHLNIGDLVTIIDKTENKIKIDHIENYWFKIITSENIVGWIFGEYLYLIPNEIPPEFADFKSINWERYYGSLPPIENITIENLQACSWGGNYRNLYFSKENNYLLTDWRFTTHEVGRYILKNNTIYLFPPLEFYMYSDIYTVDKLFYSHELHFTGAPVLKNNNETIVFTPHNSELPEIGDIIRMNQYYCEKIREEGKVITNGYLFEKPDMLSKNLLDNYYGEKATEVIALKMAKTKIENVVWYYLKFDFTSGEPIDGGGPFFYGWLPEEYFE
jgi:hypothetical protein